MDWMKVFDDTTLKEGYLAWLSMLHWYQEWQGVGGENIQFFNEVLEEFFTLPAFKSKARSPKSTVKALYPQEVLAGCEKTSEALAARARTRQHDRELVDFPRKIRRFGGGDRLVDELVARWRVIYKRRYAMQDEPNRL